MWRLNSTKCILFIYEVFLLVFFICNLLMFYHRIAFLRNIMTRKPFLILYSCIVGISMYENCKLLCVIDFLASNEMEAYTSNLGMLTH